MSAAIQKLLFVFNADSGAWAILKDVAKKLLDVPSCTLCEITHGATGERGQWKSCKAGLGVPVVYLHRDEMSDEVADAVNDALPAILAEHRDGTVEIILDSRAIAACAGDVDRIRDALRDKGV